MTVLLPSVGLWERSQVWPPSIEYSVTPPGLPETASVPSFVIRSLELEPVSLRSETVGVCGRIFTSVVETSAVASPLIPSAFWSIRLPATSVTSGPTESR